MSRHPKPPTKVFDPVAFGKTLRSERRKCGFSNTKKLSKAIEEKTGIFIDFDTLMRYERGEREPDISKITAIAFTLYDYEFKNGRDKLLNDALPISLDNALMKESSINNMNILHASSHDELRKILAIELAGESNGISKMCKAFGIDRDEAELKIMALETEQDREKYRIIEKNPADL